MTSAPVRAALAASFAVLVALFLLLSASPAAALQKQSFKPVKKTSRALVFDVRRLDGSEVRRAWAKLRARRRSHRIQRKTHRRTVTRKVRRAARTGDARLTLRRRKGFGKGKLAVVVDDTPSEPADDAPVAQEPPAEEPVVQEPVPEEPAAEEPVVEGPVAEEPVAEEPGAGLGAGAVPGTGAVIKEDLAASPDFLALWEDINPNRPERVEHFTTGGDPHPLVDGAVNRTWRRVNIEEGDHGPNEGDSRERLHIGRNPSGPSSDLNTFKSFAPGDELIVYFSVRLEPVAFPEESGSGSRSQIMQIQHDESCGKSPPLAMHQTPSGLQLSLNPTGSRKETVWKAPVAVDAWHRLALRLVMSPDSAQGRVELWGDIDGSGELEQLMPPVSDATMLGGSCGPNHHLNMGIYQDASVPAHHVDYANWQITRWVR